MKYFILIIISTFSFPVLSQDDYLDIPVSHRVVINLVDSVVYASILTTEEDVNPDLDLYYYWYKSNDIKRTRGGFDGTLLHGEYTEFYRNNSLKVKGHFDYGVKDDTWKTWYQNGELASVVDWKNGVRRGNFQEFNRGGMLVRSGRYRNNELHGKIVTYLPDGTTEENKYKRGEPVQRRPFNPFFFLKKNNEEESADEEGKEDEGETNKEGGTE